MHVTAAPRRSGKRHPALTAGSVWALLVLSVLLGSCGSGDADDGGPDGTLDAHVDGAERHDSATAQDADTATANTTAGPDAAAYIDAATGMDARAPLDAARPVDASARVDATTAIDAASSPDASDSQDASSESGLCDHSVIRCRVAYPACPEGQVPSVEGSCYGPCVPITDCKCGGPEDCPEPEQYTCHRAVGHCDYYVN